MRLKGDEAICNYTNAYEIYSYSLCILRLLLQTSKCEVFIARGHNNTKIMLMVEVYATERSPQFLPFLDPFLQAPNCKPYQWLALFQAQNQ